MRAELRGSSKTSKQANMQTVPLWAEFQLTSLCQNYTKKIPLKEQLKSNDCKVDYDSSTDRLFPMKLDIGLPRTEAL